MAHTHFTKPLRSRKAASLVEYGLLAGLISVAAIGAVLSLGSEVDGTFSTVSEKVDGVADVAENGAGNPGGGGAGGGGNGEGNSPVDPFASCDGYGGSGALSLRGTAAGGSLIGGVDEEMIYALPGTFVDGGEGAYGASGAPFDSALDEILVPGAGAVASVNADRESGRIDFPDGSAVVFANIEKIYLCDAGGDRSFGGEWVYTVYTRDFAPIDNQASLIASGSEHLSMASPHFKVEELGQMATGDAATDFGVIYTTPLKIGEAGTYTFSTTSAGGSRLILVDGNGTEVFNLNNDFDQAATTRNASVSLPAGVYTARLLYWNDDEPGATLAATINGPDTGGATLSVGGYGFVGYNYAP